ncbi:hypothetical protein PWT90_10435 [Aphanocladium album]|nr:hypothetical protein PWT90_10435 [Aphanocladium album]
MTGQVHRDRLLLTGDSPLASNNLGKLAAQTLLEDVAKRACLPCGRVTAKAATAQPSNAKLNWKDFSALYAAGEAQRLDELCRKINGAELCVRASSLRGEPRVPCKIDISAKNLSQMMGGQNCHADVTFDDGVVWIVRFRLFGPISPPTHVRDYVLQSEAATMKFLNLHTKIPAPRVFDWASEADPSNSVGIGYILMEKLQGRPLDWQTATAPQKTKVVNQLADILLEIEKHPFDKLGSLIDETALTGRAQPEAATAEPSLQIHGHAQHFTFGRGDNDGPIGPFSSSRLAAGASVKAYLQMIVEGEIGTTDNALDVFLAHRFRLDILEKAFAPSEGASQGGEKFFLKHADDKGDHIFVNEDFDIVGIIDWEWCSTASKQEAFSSPCMMWPVGEFYDGSNALADDEVMLATAFREKERDDLAQHVLNGRKVQRLLFALGPVGASHQDKRTFASLFMGLKRAFDGNAAVNKEVLGAEEAEWEAWKAHVLEEWKDDTMLQAITKGK